MIPFKLAKPNNIEENVYAGDTWRGFTLVGSPGGDDPTDVLPAVASARLQFYTPTNPRRFVYELNTATGSYGGLPTGYPNHTAGNITLIDPSGWTISVDSQPLPMGAGTYIWDLEVIDILNVKRTILTGKITICQDVTQ